MSPLHLVFMGTPDFAVPALRTLHEAGHNIVATYCQPPKPAHRGHKIKKNPVHLEAEKLGLPVYTPSTLRTAQEQEKLTAMAPDAIIVAAYGLILPQEVLDIPRLGCLNIHGSLLPRWRGAAPIHRALLAGDSQTGITIMQMDAGLDTGDMLLKESTPITPQDTSATLHDTLCQSGAKLITKALELAQSEGLTPEKQDEQKSTYAAKLTRNEGKIDWSQPAQEIERQIRALTPWPSTFFMCGEETIKLLEAEIIENLSGEQGTLLDKNGIVACGIGALRLTRIQRAGKKPTDGSSFLHGARLEKGFVFS